MVSGRSRLSWWCGDGAEERSSPPSPPSPSYRIRNELCSTRPSRQHVSLQGSALARGSHVLDAVSKDRHPPAPWLEQQSLGYLFFPSWVHLFPGNLSLRWRKFLS